jgi:hypothetical protein
VEVGSWVLIDGRRRSGGLPRRLTRVLPAPHSRLPTPGAADGGPLRLTLLALPPGGPPHSFIRDVGPEPIPMATLHPAGTCGAGGPAIDTDEYVVRSWRLGTPLEAMPMLATRQSTQVGGGPSATPPSGFPPGPSQGTRARLPAHPVSVRPIASSKGGMAGLAARASPEGRRKEMKARRRRAGASTRRPPREATRARATRGRLERGESCGGRLSFVGPARALTAPPREGESRGVKATRATTTATRSKEKGRWERGRSCGGRPSFVDRCATTSAQETAQRRTAVVRHSRVRTWRVEGCV